MSQELLLKIEFSKRLSKNEEAHFWEAFLEKLESFNLKAGGDSNSLKLEWVIDCTSSSIQKSELINEIGEFLLSNDDMILNFEIK